MTKEELINEVVITKNGDELVILDIILGNTFKNMFLKMSNEKTYNLFIAYKNGFIKFKNEKLNKELNDLINEDENQRKKDEEKIQKQQEERRKYYSKEREQLEHAIKSFRDEYSFLSNMYLCKVTYQGLTYESSESAFQAQKDPSKSSEFVGLNPVTSKRKGRKVSLRSDWEEVKVEIMEEILRCKFDQNPDLKEKLLNTGNQLLIEGNSWGDRFWGVCKEEGRNMLGKLLMKIREGYRNG